MALAVVCAGAVAVVTYVRRSAPISPAQMVSYLPAGESTLLYMDVAALRDSGILEKLAGSTVAEEPEYKAFVAQSGFDYKTDLDAVLSSTTPVQKLFLLKGRFDWKNLIQYANTHGGSCINGFCKLPGETPARSISYYPVARHVLALGIGADPDAAGNLHPPKGTTTLPGVPEQPIWLAIPASALKDAEKLPVGTKLFAKALENSERILFTLGPQADRFELNLDVTCKKAEDAAILRSELEGLTTMLGKLIARENQSPNPNDLSGVLTSGVFQRADRRVLGKWPINKTFIESLGSGGS